MSNAPFSEGRPSKNDRREAAREKARLLREEQRKRERRNKVLLGGGIGVGVLAVIAIIAFVIFTSIRPAGPGPANMASDGIKLTSDTAGAITYIPTTALANDADPVASDANLDGAVDIRIYIDYLCPFCNQFETTNNDQISQWVADGSATYEVHPIAILTSQSLGTRYSNRAANAAACVANYSPDDFLAFNNLLFKNQPEEQTEGLTNDEILGLVTEAGATDSSIEKCVNDGTFNSWVTASTARALDGPLLNTDVEKVTGTPTVLVNGVQYTGTLTDADEFAAFVLQQSAVTSTPTPTPTPSATPAG
ncbi:DsbA family protein [Naasia lichenicola]|uniref:Thioredoxin-like fold domain-containing protein n=1 Tax=Naasia lichenicola TaxID=2565933 RepID=A0A4V3WSX7_9MICO|nr:thioredoxin domain-containing protein [Naasia lichenicola]THG29827.1 hypothetical protein E6C64_14315 [Naasia lichenicola]